MQLGSVFPVHQKGNRLLPVHLPLAELSLEPHGPHGPALVHIVDEVAARAVGTETDGVKSATGLRLVLGVAREVPQFMIAVSKLALLAILTGAVLLEGPAQLRLVASGVDLGAPPGLGEGLLELLLAILAEGTVSKAVLLVGARRRGALLPTARVHVAHRVAPEVVGPVAVGVGGGQWEPHHCPPVQHAVQVDRIRALALLLLKKTRTFAHLSLRLCNVHCKGWELVACKQLCKLLME